jgi:hypothetical protein
MDFGGHVVAAGRSRPLIRQGLDTLIERIAAHERDNPLPVAA